MSLGILSALPHPNISSLNWSNSVGEDLKLSVYSEIVIFYVNLGTQVEEKERRCSDLVFVTVAELLKLRSLPSPGCAAQLVRVSSWCAQVVGSNSGEGVEEGQPMNAKISRTTGQCFFLSLSLSSSLSLKKNINGTNQNIADIKKWTQEKIDLFSYFSCFIPTPPVLFRDYCC